MVRSTILALCAMLLTANPSDAQFGLGSGQPGNWVSAGIGIFSADNVSDGKSQTTWDFTNATTPQYRISLERAISNGGGYGLSAAYVKAPIRYTSFGTGVTQCPVACDAEVSIISLGLTFHAAGGQGFHQVYGGTLGVTRYGSFERTSDGVALEPTSAVTRPSVAFSYGIGYGFSLRSQVFVVYDYGFVFHSREGLSGEHRNTLNVRPYRFGVRYGFGDRSTAGRRR